MMRQVLASVALLKSREELRRLRSCLEYQLGRKWVNHPVPKALLPPLPQGVRGGKGNFLKGGRVPGFKMKHLTLEGFYIFFSVRSVRKKKWCTDFCSPFLSFALPPLLFTGCQHQ